MITVIRVLYVEDDLVDVELVKRLLGKEFELAAVASLAAAFESLDSGKFDIVLLDLGLPDSAGLATYQRLQDAGYEYPVVILTGEDNEEIGLQAVASGAEDMLGKSQLNSSAYLTRTLKYALTRWNARNTEALKKPDSWEISHNHSVSLSSSQPATFDSLVLLYDQCLRETCLSGEDALLTSINLKNLLSKLIAYNVTTSDVVEIHTGAVQRVGNNNGEKDMATAERRLLLFTLAHLEK